MGPDRRSAVAGSLDARTRAAVGAAVEFLPGLRLWPAGPPRRPSDAPPPRAGPHRPRLLPPGPGSPRRRLLPARAHGIGRALAGPCGRLASLAADLVLRNGQAWAEGTLVPTDVSIRDGTVAGVHAAGAAPPERREVDL